MVAFDQFAGPALRKERRYFQGVRLLEQATSARLRLLLDTYTGSR